MATDAQVRAATRTAQEHVAQAIAAIMDLGPDAPSSLRESLYQLGGAFTTLGWADPAVPYSVPREDSRA